MRWTTEKYRDGMVDPQDLDFTDDVALLSNNHQDMHPKKTRMIPAKAGLRINKSKPYKGNED